jgi:Uma2 family endonuclease
MAEAGILRADDRVELIEGEVIRMSPIGSRHAGAVNRLNALFHAKVGSAGVVSVQNPIRLDDYSEPQPDLAILNPRADFYAKELPSPRDVLLIVEVSDTSSAFDRQTKVSLYARAGIAEVWLQLLAEDCVEVYSNPLEGTYRQVRIAHRGERLSPERFSQIAISVEDLLG